MGSISVQHQLTEVKRLFLCSTHHELSWSTRIGLRLLDHRRGHVQVEPELHFGHFWNTEHHFNFFGTEKQGYSFIEASPKALADKTRPYVQYKDKNGQVVSRRTHLWSDCGLSSYGTVVNIHQLVTILNAQIIHTFFPRYHGHSRCDAPLLVR